MSYGCETWSVTNRDEEILIIENGEFRGRRTYNEIYQIFSKPNIKSFIRDKRLEWAGHARRSTGIYSKRSNDWRYQWEKT